MTWQLDATTAAILTLKDHLDAQLPTLLNSADPSGIVAYVRAGWPSAEERLEYPTISINVAGGGERQGRAIILTDEVQPTDPFDPSLQANANTGSLTVPITLDVFAGSIAQRGRVLHSLEAAFATDALEGSGLITLTSSYYLDRPMTFRKDGPPQFLDSPGRVLADEYRALLNLEADMEEVVPVTLSRLLQLDLSTTVCISVEASGVSDPRTIFQPGS